MSSNTEARVATAPRSPFRLLILGFSCAAVSNSFADRIRDRLQADFRGKVLVCGLGGMTPQLVPPVLETLHRLNGPFTHVLLEISTSIYAQNTTDTEAETRDLALDCLERASAGGARVGVVHLYRRASQKLRMPWNAILSAAAEENGGLVVDLADALVGKCGRDFADSLLRDDVHTSEEGTEFQVDEIMDAVKPWLMESASVQRPIERPRVTRRGLSLAGRSTKSGQFKQKDCALEYAQFDNGEALTLEFAQGLRFFGFSFVRDRASSTLRFSLDDGAPIPVTILDEFCYLVRIGVHFQDLSKGRLIRKLRIEQCAERPPVSLRRGVADPVPLGKLVDVLYFE